MNAIDKQIDFTAIDRRLGSDQEEPRADRTEDIVALTGEEQDILTAKSKIAEYTDQALGDIISQGQLYNMSVDDIINSAEELGRKRLEFDQNPDFIIEQAGAVNDVDYSDVQTRYMTNMQIASEIVAEKRRQAGEDEMGFLGFAGDFVDRYLFRQLPIGMIEDLTARTERKGREVLEQAIALPPQEFSRWMQSYADEVSTEGVFGDENYFAAVDLQTEVESAGFDPNKGTKQFFGIVDAVTLGAPLAKLGVKGIGTALKSSTAVGRVAAVKGTEAAGEAAENILKKSPDPVTLGNVGPSPLDLNPQTVRTSLTRFARKFQENDIIRKIDDLWRKGAFGKVADEGQIKSLAAKAAEKYADNTVAPLYDFQIVDEGLGVYTAAIRLGKSETGEPFKMSTIRTLTERIPNSKMVPVDPDDLSKGFLVEVTERINLAGVADPLSVDLQAMTGVVRSTIGKLMDNELMASSSARDAEILTALSQRSEAGRAAVKEVVQPYLNALNKLDSKSRFTLKALYQELRDGKDSYLRVRYTDEEFIQKFKEFHPDGKAATQKDLDAYHALATIEEADYVLKTVDILGRYVQKGYTQAVEISEGIFVPARQVTKGQADEIFDIESFDVAVKDNLPDDIPVWKLDKPYRDKYLYITKPLNQRIIEPTDVMGYNPGGTRRNPLANYFIVAGQKAGRLKALMTAFSQKQANQGLEQIKTIRDAIRSGASGIDDIIRNNNDWNPSIESLDEFNKFVEKEGWDLYQDLGVKSRDEEITAGELVNGDVFNGMKADDFIQNDMRRNDKVLTHFGGGKTYNEDPVNAILSQFGSTVFTYSNKAYTQAAMVGWVKAVQKAGRGWFREGVSSNDYEILFRTAEVTGNDQFSRRMNELRNITMRRLNMKDDFGKAMDSFGARLGEYVFDKTGVILPSFLREDPTNNLLKVGFQSAFGFLNLSQFVMQGFHATTIMAISPKHGFRAAGLVPALRGALRASDPETMAEAIKRIAKAADIDEAQAKELFEYIKTSGRQVVDGDAVEDGTGVGFNISGYNGESMTYSVLRGRLEDVSRLTGKGLDLGLMPFKSGERLSRLTAMTTAFFEFKAANPRVSALSETARNWISRREQNLTFNMNSNARSMAQSGFMKVPTQWLTYTMRAMEAVFVGRDFTAAERARLFAALGPMYGLTGLGLEHSAGYVAEKMGVEPDSSLYVGLKYGVLDWMASEADVPVALGTRLAPIGALTDVYKKIFEEETITALGGPSGEITGGIVSAFMDAFESLYNGHTVSLTEDMMKVIRQPSGIDNIAKAIGILNNGIYRSKNGIVSPGEMSVSEALITGLGFTPQQVVEFYSLKGQVYSAKKTLSQVRKEVNKDTELAFRLINSDDDRDIDRGIQLMKEIHATISLSGLSFKDQLSLRRSATSRMEAEWPRISKHLIERDKAFQARATEKIIFRRDNE